MAGVARKQVMLNKPGKGLYQTSLSLGDLPRGEYLIMLNQGNWHESRKVIKL